MDATAREWLRRWHDFLWGATWALGQTTDRELWRKYCLAAQELHAMQAKWYRTHINLSGSVRHSGDSGSGQTQTD